MHTYQEAISALCPCTLQAHEDFTAWAQSYSARKLVGTKAAFAAVTTPVSDRMDAAVTPSRWQAAQKVQWAASSSVPSVATTRSRAGTRHLRRLWEGRWPGNVDDNGLLSVPDALVDEEEEM